MVVEGGCWGWEWGMEELSSNDFLKYVDMSRYIPIYISQVRIKNCIYQSNQQPFESSSFSFLRIGNPHNNFIWH